MTPAAAPSISSCNGNRLVLQFLDTRFKDNIFANDTGPLGHVNQLSVFGYWTYLDRPIGTDNQARVRVRLAKGDTYQLDAFTITDCVRHSSEPLDPTNNATVFSWNIQFVVKGHVTFE